MAKKRANGEGSIRKRSDGRWEGRYTVGYDENGKVKMKNVLGKTQAEVKKKLKEKIEEAKVLDVSKSESYTVAEWAALWFEVYTLLAQLDRVPDYESGGRRFISCRACHIPDWCKGSTSGSDPGGRGSNP